MRKFFDVCVFFILCLIFSFPSFAQVEPTVLVSWEGGSAHFDLEKVGNTIYWSRQGDIFSVSTSGGEIRTLCSNCNAKDLTSDGSYVWFLTSNAVKRVNIATEEEIKTIATTSSPILGGAGIFVDNIYVYWADASNICKVARDGGRPVVKMIEKFYPVSMAQSDSFIFSSGSENIVKLQKYTKGVIGGPGTPSGVSLAQNVILGDEVVVHEGYVYWSQNGNAIKRIKIQGGIPDLIKPSNLLPNSIVSLATDGSYIYYIVRPYNTFKVWEIKRISISEKRPAEILYRATNALADDIQVDANYIYWGDIDGIKRLPKNPSE